MVAQRVGPTLADLGALFAPRAIAVVGATERAGPGRQVIENLRAVGYKGAIVPVHPRHQRVLGMPCSSTLVEAARREPVDLAAVVVGRDRVLEVLEDAAAAHIPAAWVLASGFGEADDKGRNLEERLVHLCRDANIALCGPNCVGAVLPGRMAAFSAPIPERLPAGRVGAVAQSGSVCIALLGTKWDVGWSYVISSGNEAVLDITDYIAHMLEDPGTDVILAFVEQFRRPDRLREVARRALALGKPLVVLKVGRSQVAQQAARTHTGALAGSDEVHDAFFSRYGILRVDDLDELLQTARAFIGLGRRRLRGGRAGVLTLSGGEIGLIGDLSEGLSLTFPGWSAATARRLAEHLPPYAEISNPLDAWGSGRIAQTFPPCLATAADDSNVDLIIISLDMPLGMAPGQAEDFAVVARTAGQVAASSDKPLFLLSNVAGEIQPELEELLGGIPVLRGTRAGLRALHHVIRYQEFTVPDEGQAGAAPRGASYLHRSAGLVDEHGAKKVLAEYGIACCREELCMSQDEALAAAERMGYPVVLKLVAEGLTHKSELGAVRTSVEGPEAVRAAYLDLINLAQERGLASRMRGILVQEMVTGAVAETVLGIARDPAFGPVIVFGLGGVWVEVLRERALAIPPLDSAQARTLIAQTRVARFLAGVRGKPRGDLEATAQALVRLGQLALDWADRIEGLDINPLLVLPEGQGVVAVDALIELRSDGQHQEREGRHA